MDEQEAWQNQYDRSFAVFPLITSPHIYQQLSLTATQRFQWRRPTLLPELCRLFELVESFINDHRNWNKRSCSEQQMTIIEGSLNNLMITLQCEKIYGLEYWQASERRVQASVVHFYTIVKMFMVALIPSNCNSLIHANSQDKLVTEILKLEVIHLVMKNLVNQIIQLMKAVHSFMYNPIFSTEKELTDDFFKELFEFFKNLPRIRKESMHKIPKIMDFINVCLEIDDIQQGPKTLRSKASITSRGRESSRGERENNFIKKNSEGHEGKKQGLELFKFYERGRSNTSYRNKKKLTVTSIQTKEKSQSNDKSHDKSRSPSLDRSLNLFESQRLKRSTLAESPRRQSSNQRGRARIMTTKTNNSQRSRQRQRQRSRKQSLEDECIEQERDTKTKKKKEVKLPVKLGHFSEQMNLQKGFSRGWGVIRQYINKKIAQRKLRNLLLF